jgi:RNA polymerase sigma factor (TIGR02999 family)
LNQQEQYDGDGDEATLNAKFCAHYDVLRAIARGRLRRSGELTLLESSDLVNEVFAKFGRNAPPVFENDNHFLAYASTAMRTLVIDHARARARGRRGGGLPDLTLYDEACVALEHEPQALIEIDAALTQLRAIDTRLAQVVEMRFFAGFTEEEIALALNVSSRTIKRDWEKARLILAALLVA